MRTKFYLFSISVLFLITPSCSTYYIAIDSFKNQFAGIDSTKLKNVTVRGPMYETYNYMANPIKVIKCVDKNGNASELVNSPSIEIRITNGEKNKRTVFYFDRIFVDSANVVGVESRFMSFIRKSIPLNSITKIEVQDGHKKFSYK